MFNNREEEAKREKERERKAKYAFLAAAIKGRDQPGPSHPRTGLKTLPPNLDHASDATSQDTGQRHAQTHNPPAKACLTCGQWGHWKMDCPQGRPGTLGEVPTAQTWRVECPQGCRGTSGEIPTSPQKNPSPTLRELLQ